MDENETSARRLLLEVGYSRWVVADMDTDEVFAAAARVKKSYWYACRELRRARDEFVGEVLAAVKRNAVAIRRWAERVWRFFHR